MTTVHTGLENVIQNPPAAMLNKRLGLLCNPASVNAEFIHSRHLISRHFPGQLTTLFSPQHGFFAEKQDNMIESADLIDPDLGIPVHSLYSQTRIPSKKMFADIDVLLVDIQDVGTRVYTFIYTLSYCMEAAKKYGKTVLVLDRPNPINGLLTEGNLLNPDYASFVGRYKMPMRHGLTIGEIAQMFNGHFDIGCTLDVVPMTGWKRTMYFTDTGLPWIPPSPNLPTPASAMVYPGQVIWEGTNISEGRGTAQPFEICGAPFLDSQKILDVIGHELPGIHLRPTAFEPTANKWAGTVCHGFQIHVTSPDAYRPYFTSLQLLRAIRHLYPDQFEWKRPPYEYEFEKQPIDLIFGDKVIRQRLEANETVASIQKSWLNELQEFNRLRSRFYLYTE